MARRPEQTCAPWLMALILGACAESGRSPPDGAGADTAPSPDGTLPDGALPDAHAPDAATPDDYTLPESLPPAVRRLSTRELANTYRDLLGVVPSALGEVPPDPRDHTFDRVVNAQTVSLIHLEAYDRAAREAALALLAERRLDDLAPTCDDAILPPTTSETHLETAGIALVAYPDWALVPGDGNPERLMIRYAPECGVSTSHAAPADGIYRVALAVELVDRFAVTLSVDGEVVASWDEGGDAPLTLTWQGPLAAGNHQLAFDFRYLPAGGNPYVWVQSLSVTGPLDPAAARTAERRACVADLVDALAPRAFRRPLASAERDRLLALHDDALAAGGTFGEALAMVLRAILSSPKFLYLIETGTAVAPGRFALDDWAIAARLAYALCESPPDAPLRARAAAGELQDGAAVRAEAERLMGEPCARETLRRFYRQWLWLDRLPSTARDPALFPSYSSATSESLLREADRFLEAATFEERLDFEALHTTRRSYVDTIVADLYGLDPVPAPPAPPALVAAELPPERSGLLTLPGVLAVTSKFSQTSPVIRGVYVLEQILCDDLPSPPDEVDTTPPALDPAATSRERWAAHSESDACRPCHDRIDPIGFLFEEFDATGRHRTSENGLPIDATGYAPALGIREPVLEGVAPLAALVATSERATTCLSRQWLRFALGRLEEDPDADAIHEVAAALRGTPDQPARSLLDAFITLTGTRAFRERVERQPEATP